MSTTLFKRVFFIPAVLVAVLFQMQSNVLAFITSSLTVSLNFDENSGTTATDRSGNSHNGTVAGTPTWSGGNITFDGSDDKITISDANALDAATHSYEVWFTMPSSGDWSTVSSQFPRLIDKVPSNTLSGTNILVHQSTRTVRAYFGGSSWSSPTVGSVSANFLIGSNTLDYNTKYHIVFTYNDTTKVGKIYVDNVLVASATSGGSYVANTANLAIGGNPYDNTRNIKGTIHRVSVYSKELNSTEIQDNYTTGSDYNYDVTTSPGAATSTVTASPTSVVGDDSTTSTITVTVLNASGSALSGKVVSLSSSRGTFDTINPSTATTDGSGVATFTVKSANAGTATYTAVSENITITDTADVTYTSGITTANGVTYTSTLDSLSMKMDVSYNALATDLPIVLVLHGHTTTVPDGVIQRLANKGVFAIRTYKRGFNSSQGTSDDGGKEVYDFRDAVEYVKTNYGAYVDPDNVHVIGYSGGGGNAYGLITRFPDYFNTASIFFGMSDYGHNATYGWYTNGATGTQQTLMQSRIGGTPAAVPDKYYARAFTLGAKNNPYTYTQLFYDQDETNVPQSHATQYRNNAVAEGFTNVVNRFSDATTLTTELSDDLSTNLSEWSSRGAGASDITWNSGGGYINWTTDRNATFDSLYKKFDSHRSLSKSNRFKATFSFTVSSSAGNDSLTMIGFKNSGDTVLRNTAVLVLNNVSGTVKPYVRIDYNGTPLNTANRTLQIFSNSITIGQTYNFELEVNSGTLIGTLKDASFNTIESQTISFDSSKTFDGVDSFGIANFNGNNGSLLQSGTLDNITVSSWSRWYHGYPEEGATGEPNISAENYIIPGILAGTYAKPTLQTSDSLFIPGVVRTNSFQVLLGTGADEAANLQYNIAGNGNSSATAKTFTLENLTGAATVNLSLYGLQANTQYAVIDDNTVDTTTSTKVTTNGSGVLSYSGSSTTNRQYRVYSDDTAPTATNLATTPTQTTVSISWTTNESASTKVDYGLTTAYGSSTAEQNTYTRVTSHSTTLTGLAACTRYHYRVRSKDTAANELVGDSNYFITSGCTGSAAVQASTVADITAASGGSVNLTESSTGIALSVPAGFAGSDANFQIKRLEKTATLNSTSTPTGYSLIANYLYDMKALSDVNTVISSFNTALTVTMTYTNVDTTGIDESTLKIYRWDGARWSALSNCSVNTSTKTVTCSTTAFSVFGLFGQTTASSGSSSTASNITSSGLKECTDQKPGGTPELFQIDRNGSAATLHVTPGGDPYNSFFVSYGVGGNTGQYAEYFSYEKATGAMTHEIRDLDPKITYSFRVQPMNGCMAGEWSNTLAVGAKNGKYFKYGATQLGVRTKSVAARVRNSVSPKKGPTRSTDTTTTQPANVHTTPTMSAQPTPAAQPDNSGGLWGWVKGFFR